MSLFPQSLPCQHHSSQRCIWIQCTCPLLVVFGTLSKVNAQYYTIPSFACSTTRPVPLLPTGSLKTSSVNGVPLSKLSLTIDQPLSNYSVCSELYCMCLLDTLGLVIYFSLYFAESTLSFPYISLLNIALFLDHSVTKPHSL